MRPFWLAQALQADTSDTCPALQGEVRTDVCIVGGGYTGLWTAIMLKQQNPELDCVADRGRHLRRRRQWPQWRVRAVVVGQVLHP